MSDTVYIVTSGTYSDYHIDRVFSNEDAAQSFIDHFDDSDDYRIETWPINTAFDAERVWWQVIVWPKHGDRTITRTEEMPGHVDVNHVYPLEPRIGAGKFADGQRWEVWVQAASEALALKIAQDLVAQHRAEREGIV